MKLKQLQVVTVAAVALAAACQTMQAGELIYRFEGSVVSNTVSRSPWNAPIVGDLAFLEFSVDASIPDAFPQFDSHALYQDAVTAFSVTIGGVSGAGDGGYVQVGDAEPGVEADFFGVGDMLLTDDFDMAVIMFNLSADAFSSVELPTALLITDWYPAIGRLWDLEQSGAIEFEWGAVEVVPAPGASALSIIAGLFALQRGRRRRHEPQTEPISLA